MDTELLIQRLVEFRGLLEKLQHEITQLAPGTGTAPDSHARDVAPSIEADPPASFNEQGSRQVGELVHRLLSLDVLLLEENQQHLLLLQSILNNSPAGLAIVSGPELIFRLATPTYRSMTPYPDEDIIGVPFREVWPASLGYNGEELIRQMLGGNKDLQFDRLEQRYPDGLIHSFSLRICRLTWYGEMGALILMQETTQADRARRLAMEIAEEAYRQAEELDTIIIAMAEAIILFDARGVATRANPAAVDLFGMDPVGISYTELFDTLGVRSPDGSPLKGGELPFERALHGETVIGERLLFIDRQGQELVVDTSFSPLFSAVAVSGVVTVWHDVTEREQLLEQLGIEQSRLETIIENAPEAILVADEEGRLVMGNRAAELLLGKPLPYREDFSSHVNLNICYEDGTPYNPRYLPLTCSALDGQHLKNVELMVRSPDGTARHLIASTAPIVDRKGNLNGAVGVFQDITQHKQTEASLRRQARRSQLLASLTQAFAETGLNYSELLETIVEQVGKVMGKVCALHLFTEDTREHYLAALYTVDSERSASFLQMYRGVRFPADEGFAAMVLESSQPVVLTNYPAGKLKGDIPQVYWPMLETAAQPYLNGILVPLRAHGRWIGVLTLVRDQQDSPYQEEDRTFLQDLADRAALAIEDARLYEQEAQRARELQALNQATTALLSTLDLETLLTQILEAVQKAIPAAEQGALYLLSKADDALEVRATFGCTDEPARFAKMQEYAQATVQKQVSLLFVDKGSQIEDNPDPGLTRPAHSAIAAPLLLKQQVLGALVLFGSQQALFTDNELRLLDSFAATATAAIHNASLYAEVQRLATTDTLTEQYNRRKFFELGEVEIHRLRRFKTPLSAIMFDVDNFKEINDTYGHGAGDQVLRTVAQRCHSNIRVIDILCRYGGDEFAILLPNAGIEESYEIADRIRQSVTSEPVKTQWGEIHLTISLGVAQAKPASETLSSLLGRADTALYVAKQSGRNRVAMG